MEASDPPEEILSVLTMPGIGRAVPIVRHHLSKVLGSDHPAFEALAICATELVTNGIVHTRSGQGGHVTVALSEKDGMFRLDVSDDGQASTEPHVSPRADESGRGLLLVQEYAAEWHAQSGPYGTTVTAIVKG